MTLTGTPLGSTSAASRPVSAPDAEATPSVLPWENEATQWREIGIAGSPLRASVFPRRRPTRLAQWGRGGERGGNFDAVAQHPLGSHHLRARAFGELAALAEETREPDWDGYGADPTTPQARSEAERFLRGLPAYLPDPEVSVSTDGQFTFDWYGGPASDRIFSVQITAAGSVHYSGLFGAEQEYGTQPLSAEIWDMLVRNLMRLAG